MQALTLVISEWEDSNDLTASLGESSVENPKPLQNSIEVFSFPTPLPQRDAEKLTTTPSEVEGDY